ncbi:MAG: hypothetical protein P1Q69_12335 [Candidatus Thorarchaeota archaeon]|nr:hypothetical protein [Candidatus Thorarchaeota archaeon]
MNDVRGSVEDFLSKWEEADEIERHEIVDQIGRRLTVEYYHLFADILADSIKTGTLDVTGWTREAVKAALVVCSEKNLSVTFKNGNRTVAPVSYPREGLMLEMFVNAIMTGVWS